MLGEGISVNVTLIFGLERYGAVMDAFLERPRAGEGRRPRRLDARLGRLVLRLPGRHRDRRAARQDRHRRGVGACAGRPAIANARLAYEAYEEVFASDRWKALAAAGAKPQRPLWASTGVKDPAYDDTRYVVDLVAPGTVNTMPEATLNAVADHGVIRGDAVQRHVRRRPGDLRRPRGRSAIDYDDVIELLEVEGVDKFEDSWE